MSKAPDLSDGEAQYASLAAVPEPHAPALEQAEGSQLHPEPKSRGLRGWVPAWVLIAPIVLGLMLTVAWTLWLGYELVGFTLWLLG